jgi:hypothetical protein
MTDTLSLDDREYKVKNMYTNNIVISTIVTYKNFDVPENREVRWNDNGRYGPDMYYVVPLPETFADVVTHNSRMLGPHLPTTQETVVPTESVEQVQEKTYHHKGPHYTEPALRRRKYRRYRSQSATNPLHTGKPNHRSRSPGELDHGYHKDYEYGVGVDDYYYRPEMIAYDDYYYEGYYEKSDYDDYYNDGGCDCYLCCDCMYDENEHEYEDCRNCGELFNTRRYGDVCTYCGY